MCFSTLKKECKTRQKSGVCNRIEGTNIMHDILELEKKMKQVLEENKAFYKNESMSVITLKLRVYH
jgi:hypothetical protein